MENISDFKQQQNQMAQLEAECEALRAQIATWDQGDIETHQLLKKCLLTASKIVTGYRQKKSDPENENDNLSLEYLSPEEKLIGEIRINLRASHASKIPSELLDWLLTWSAKLDNKVLEKALHWITDANVQLEHQQVRWTEKLEQTKGGFGFFSRLRCLALVKKIKQVENSIADLDKQIGNYKLKLQNSLTFTRIAAGMLSASLRLGAGNLTNENKLIRKVFEYESEQEIKAHLAKINFELEEKIKEKQNFLSKLDQEVNNKKSIQKKIETNKNQLMINIYTQTNLDPKNLLANATDLQIRRSYAELDYLIDSEAQKLKSEKEKVSDLKKEFVKLAEVVHDYSTFEKSKKERETETSDSAGGLKKTRKLSCQGDFL